MKKVLIYFSCFGDSLGGSEYLPLLFISELQRRCDVTLALNWQSDIAHIARLAGLSIDTSNLKVEYVKPKGSLLQKLDAIVPFYRVRRLKELSKDADICISAANIIDFGKPAHHFVYLMRHFGDNAFIDYFMHNKQLSGIAKVKRNARTFLAEIILRPLLGLRSTRKILADKREHIYPCAMKVYEDQTGKVIDHRDNYPPDFTDELTGPQATVNLSNRLFYPCPMLQLSVFRRLFLIENDLKCIYGLRNQDSEFSPRALYLAKRVSPLHEEIYIYRIRDGSVQSSARSYGYFYRDWSVILLSLFAFHAKVSSAPGFDRAVTKAWAKTWLSTLFIKWFSRDFVAKVPRKERLDSLKKIFSRGMDDFNSLLNGCGSRPRRIAGWWVKAFVRYAVARPLAEAFFNMLYFPILQLKRAS